MINKERILNTFLNFALIDAPSRSEREVAEKIISVLEPLGFKIIMDEAGKALGGNCGNLYAVLEGENSDLDPILFCAHMDTVLPCYFKHIITDDDGKVHSDGKTIVGADDVTAIVEILEALTVIYDNRLPHRTIELLFTVAEEKSCRGSRLFDFSQIQSDQCYVLDYDGAVGNCAFSAPAKLSFTAKIHGKSAHAGFSPEQGISAISVMAQAIMKIKQGRISKTATLNIGTITGGNSINVVPDYCAVTGEIREQTTDGAVKLADKLKTELEEICASLGAELEFNYELLYSSFKAPKAHSIITRYKNACRSLGIESKLEYTLGGSDCNIISDAGITGLVIANGMHNCHSTDEYTTVDEMTTVAEILVKLMTED